MSYTPVIYFITGVLFIMKKETTMNRFVIEGIFDEAQPATLYYAGLHYQNTKAFTSSVYMATTYSSKEEAYFMLRVLSLHFQQLFVLREIRIQITVVN